MEATHITSNLMNGKLGILNDEEEDDDDDDDDNDDRVCKTQFFY